MSLSSISASTSSGDLRTDKSKAEAKLAESKACASAKTPEGKAKIRDLTTTLRTIDAKIDQAKTEANSPVASNPTDTVGNGLDLYA